MSSHQKLGKNKKQQRPFVFIAANPIFTLGYYEYFTNNSDKNSLLEER